jgi:hypothetical protein
MDEPEWLAERFEEKRGHLRVVAYRMLGSVNEADDAVQITQGIIVAIDLVADPERIGQLDLEILSD